MKKYNWRVICKYKSGRTFELWCTALSEEDARLAVTATRLPHEHWVIDSVTKLKN